jgi:hypothetical protein
MNEFLIDCSFKQYNFDPALCHFDPALCGIARDHGPALCVIALDLHTNSIQEKVLRYAA